jgi:hypothetical protein
MSKPGIPEDSDQITWKGLHWLNGRVALCLGILNLFLGVALNISANKASLGGWVSSQCRPAACFTQPLSLIPNHTT